MKVFIDAVFKDESEKWLRFLLSELERVSEISQELNNEMFGLNMMLESEREENQRLNGNRLFLIEENRKLREERDYWKGYGEEGIEREKELLGRLQSAHQEIDRLKKALEAVKEVCKNSEAYTDGAKAYFIAHKALEVYRGKDEGISQF